MKGTTNMCTRFVYNGKETIVGFNFDIDLSEWEHTVIAEKDRFFIGIKISLVANCSLVIPGFPFVLTKF